MESSVADISDLHLEEKYKRYRLITETLVNINFPNRETRYTLPEDVRHCLNRDDDEKNEENMRAKLEAEITYEELEDVKLRYIPENIRKLRHKRDRWERKYHLCRDPDEKWRKYEKQLNKEIIKHKTVIKNLDKEQNGEESYNLSHSLDPERVERLVDYIKEKESNDGVLEAMQMAAMFSFNWEEHAYVRYAIYARYGKYIYRPSRLILLTKKE